MPDSNQHSELLRQYVSEGLRFAEWNEEEWRELAEAAVYYEVKYRELIEQLEAEREATRQALVAHGVEKQAKHNIEAELRGLREQLEAAQERLARYEEPGWINSVQAVVAARSALRLVVECEDALTEDGYLYLVEAAREVLGGSGSNPASSPKENA